MDPITSAALFIVISAVFFYVGYWVVRKAVSAAITDARRTARSSRDA